MNVRIDLHTHSRFSSDGVSDPEGMVAAARARGLHGFAITDHDTCAGVDWFEQHGLLPADGAAVDGLLIIPGQEISTAEGHLLALGVRLPGLRGIPAREAVDLVHDLGGVVVAAHPFDRFRSGLRPPLLDGLPVDAVEVFNAACAVRAFNDRALAYARRRGVPMTAGSDAHHEAALGGAWTELEVEALDCASVLRAVKAGGAPCGGYQTARDAFIKTFHLMFRSGRRQAEGKGGRG